MPSLDESVEYDPVRAIVYGPTGSGKTSLWAQMAKYDEFRPIYCLDFDLRISSIRAVLEHDEMKHIKFDYFRDKNIQGEAYIAAESVSRNIKGLNTKYNCEFKTIVIDSGTFMATSIMNRVLFLDGGKPGTVNPQLQHYLQLQSLQQELISRFAYCGLNFIFTCHEDATKDEITGRLFKSVDLNGKSANKIPGFFNEFWHTEIRLPPGKDPEFVVRTRPDVIFGARTSYRYLESVERQENIWPKIIAAKRGPIVTAIPEEAAKNLEPGKPIQPGQAIKVG